MTRSESGNSERLVLEPGAVTLTQLRTIWASERRIDFANGHRDKVAASEAAVADICRRSTPTYGINTGFGKLAQTRIPEGDLDALQRNLVLSHCCGTGAALDDRVVRLTLALKAASLAQGYSGIRGDTIDALVGLFNAGVYPVVPGKGSVGASGDLAPLAHLSAVLIGVGDARIGGETRSAADGLKHAGLAPITLGPKEGLALINGTQVSTALALDALFRTERLFAWAIVAGALCVDAMLGSVVPFDARISELRRHPGQQAVADALRGLLTGSDLVTSHKHCSKVQDPYSLRCQPQVMGAVLDTVRHVARVLLLEANAVTDNPLVFADDGVALSGGNFHAEPVALAADQLALAIAEIGAIAERRIANLLDQTQSQLPAFLVDNAGLNSGFMIAQVTAAAVASENKSLAHPASVDSLPTSANQEDHVSMATFAARRLADMIDNSETVVAIELLAAVQGIEFHRPTRSSDLLETVIGDVRARVPHYAHDRYFASDIAAAKRLASTPDALALVPCALCD